MKSKIVTMPHAQSSIELPYLKKVRSHDKISSKNLQSRHFELRFNDHLPAYEPSKDKFLTNFFKKATVQKIIDSHEDQITRKTKQTVCEENINQKQQIKHENVRNKSTPSHKNQARKGMEPDCEVAEAPLLTSKVLREQLYGQSAKKMMGESRFKLITHKKRVNTLGAISQKQFVIYLENMKQKILKNQTN